LAATQELFFLDVILGDALTTLLTYRLVVQAGFDKLWDDPFFFLSF